MAKEKSVADTIGPWLRSNLGSSHLGALTGTDARALKAAIQIIELYSYHRRQEVLDAFKDVVECMQEKTRYLAYHGIAHVLNWEDRERIWNEASLEYLSGFGFGAVCAFEPSGDKKPRR